MSFGIDFNKEKFFLSSDEAVEKIDKYLYEWNVFEEEANMVFFFTDKLLMMSGALVIYIMKTHFTIIVRRAVNLVNSVTNLTIGKR